MNCKEAQDKLGWVWDLPKYHPDRQQLEWHLLGCEPCRVEYEIWQESQNILMDMPIQITDEQAERVNRNVMDRIYAESPWLAPGGDAVTANRRIRKRLAVWIAASLAVFLCSILVYFTSGPASLHGDQPAPTGLIQTAVAGEKSVSGTGVSFDLNSVSNGIIEPFVVGMGPAYPQYWMIVSMLGMGLALFAWRRVRRLRN
ncbi:hypothetical protein DCC85_12700 [Paenibacillus sp. CAA11]|uniref:zf-HC2 domain-containing protein n=1 Tax=Paenibacillus sp. CAA11 TaxID=1532905 RepID=UPI000D3647C6|nr:zf-HC2 domain-containing protein [Paenibacillus sp. CAA11]AWB44995.1 hypothetical protein DCC85_12700 [Paenibacillus sp. CAA11]